MNLSELKAQWVDEPGFHKHIHELFTQLVNATPTLKLHRDYVEQRVFGMGERSFWWLWKMICDELPDNPKLLEIGVFKAATVSLWRLLSPHAQCFGVTPLDGRGTGWTEDDYLKHIGTIHEDFGLRLPSLIVGSSQDGTCIASAKSYAPYDVVYIDGSHTYEDALADLDNYAPMVAPGGFLVIDDCNCDMNFPPSGFFTGIDTVTQAKQKWLETQADFEFWVSVVHISVFRRK